MSGPPAAPPAAGSGALRAWAEVLRAPLLLSPTADVLAGWCLAFGAMVIRARSLAGADTSDLGRLAGAGTLLRAALAGTCLLAAGMAQNALVDLEDDRRRKPGRPLPRGAIAPGAVRGAQYLLWTAALLLAASIGEAALQCAGVLVALTCAYHLLLKRWRLPGCLALGALRALDFALGAVAFEIWAAGARDSGRAPLQFTQDIDFALLIALLYGLYMAGASLHASTDDEAASWPWSGAGLLTSAVALGYLLGLLSRSGEILGFTAGWLTWLTAATLLAALLRLLFAWRRLPPPALTGVALSNLYLIDAAACFGSGVLPMAAVAGLLVLGLFGVSRMMLRVFAPT